MKRGYPGCAASLVAALFVATPAAWGQALDAPAPTNPTTRPAPPTYVSLTTTVQPRHTDYTTPRFEPAGFPLVAGSSDIGVLFGAAGTLTRFQGGVRPYAWNMDLVLSASLKSGPTGLEIAQQNYLWDWDIPGLLGNRLRLGLRASYRHTVNQGYFGLGNASSGVRPLSEAGLSGRYYEYIDSQARLRALGRIAAAGPLSVMVGGSYRFSVPTAYAGSQFALDSATVRAGGAPWIYGTGPLSLPELVAGVVIDTRDFEVAPTRGIFYQLGLRGVLGLPLAADVRYVSAAVDLAHYVPLGSRFVLAFRFVADIESGHVPFYDLYTGGPFTPDDMPGGSSGIRGVPSGRYLGPIKFVANLELRAVLFDFTLFRQAFRVGAEAFFDTGRVWSDYSFASPLDGPGVGLKYGVGAGLNLRWGQTAIFRVEMAYSPDAESENPGFPFGIYVEDGLMF